MTHLHGFLVSCMVAFCFISCQSTSTESTPESSATKHPNVLLIISDDQSYRDYSFMQHPAIETPNLDQLASNSLCFTRGYVTAPLCSPSLASIITGLYAHQHGVTGNDPTFTSTVEKYSTEWRMEREAHYKLHKDQFYKNPLLTTYLKEADYLSLQTGKWWLGSWKDAQFDAGMTHGIPEEGGRHGDKGLEIGRSGLETIFDFISDAQEKTAPFFVWYAPFLPHTPHNPPDSLLQKYLSKTSSEPIARYWAMCDWFDQTCGALLQHLEEKDILEETLIIYTSDNGWIQDSTRVNRYAERSKRSPYEDGIRTPLMLSWQGVIQPKIDSVHAVSNVDIMPTILSQLQLEEQPDLPGLNLMDARQLDHRQTVFVEDFAHDMADPVKPAASLQNRIAIDYPYKLIWPFSPDGQHPEAELYDLSNDPGETNNLVSNKANISDRLKSELDAWWTPSQ